MNVTCSIRVSAWLDEVSLYLFSNSGKPELKQWENYLWDANLFVTCIFIKNDLLSTYPMPSTVVQLNSFLQVSMLLFPYSSASPPLSPCP